MYIYISRLAGSSGELPRPRVFDPSQAPEGEKAGMFMCVYIYIYIVRYGLRQGDQRESAKR